MEIDIIESRIKALEVEYQKIQGLILSESDLKCLLFHKLLEDFGQPTRTRDPWIDTIKLHTEIPWYDEEGKLTLRPDITILDPRNTSILHGTSVRIKNGKIAYGKLPEKGFEFTGPATVIEIKFVKKKRGISKSDVARFDNDAEKILRLARRFSSHNQTTGLLGIIVIFNKTCQVCPEFDHFRDKYTDTPNLKVIYGTGRISFGGVYAR